MATLWKEVHLRQLLFSHCFLFLLSFWNADLEDSYSIGPDPMTYSSVEYSLWNEPGGLPALVFLFTLFSRMTTWVMGREGAWTMTSARQWHARDNLAIKNFCLLCSDIRSKVSCGDLTEASLPTRISDNSFLSLKTKCLNRCFCK